jgi:hypothetical protein
MNEDDRFRAHRCTPLAGVNAHATPEFKGQGRFSSPRLRVACPDPEGPNAVVAGLVPAVHALTSQELIDKMRVCGTLVSVTTNQQRAFLPRRRILIGAARFVVSARAQIFKTPRESHSRASRPTVNRRAFINKSLTEAKVLGASAPLLGAAAGPD